MPCARSSKNPPPSCSAAATGGAFSSPSAPAFPAAAGPGNCMSVSSLHYHPPH